MAEAVIRDTLRTIPNFFRLKYPHAWFDYDEQADALYVSFERPQQATDSELRPDNIIVRRRGKKVVGLTVLDARRFHARSTAGR